tara:strand:+ start:364 stop:690 length:327 start_codon:yes stop_codon:yes gene_type:complete
MYLNVSEHDFINISEQYRDHKDNFSYYGKKALYKYLVDKEESIGEELEMDWIAFCCAYTEWDSRKELLDYYDEKTLGDIMDKTDVIEFKYYTDRVGNDWHYRYIVLNY